ncbi:MAG: hypothetical protein JNM88_19265 [Chitinophagaceae bacterium]|nr:hypothetical protein [Chitinophagaceae bacterium]
MKKAALIKRLFPLLFLFACKNDDKTATSVGSSEVDQDFIFFDYQVRGEEDNDQVTVLLQYRQDIAEGSTLFLDKKSKVELDGELIPADSAKITGAYYELQKAKDSFTGTHSITFTDANGRQYKEQFSFQPLQLMTEIPASVPFGELELQLEGVEPGDEVRIVLTDTLFGSEGVDRLEVVGRDKKLVVTREEMALLAPGPIQMELVKESETPVENGTASGGRLYMSFMLRREFMLTR